MSTGYAACYIRTIFPNQLNPSNFVSSADCFVTVCMMETAAVVDGILNWKWKLEHENLTNLSELLSHLVAFLSSEAFDIKKQHRMINYLPNGFGKQNVNSTCIHTKALAIAIRTIAIAIAIVAKKAIEYCNMQ